MAQTPLRPLRFAPLALALALALAGPSRAAEPPEDADVFQRKPITSEQVRRWTKVSEAELAAPFPAFRELARQVADGTPDVRVLRAYSRLYPRLYPFDAPPPPDLVERAIAQKDALARRGREAKTAPPVDGCWTFIGPRNIPGRMLNVVVHPADPATVWVGGADGGVWKTVNRGASWLPLSDFEPSLAIGGLAVDPVDPDVIYMGTGEGNYAVDNYGGVGVLKSTDGGVTWSRVPLPGVAVSYFHKIVVDPLDRTRIWGATTNGLFWSADSGATWSLVPNLPAEDVTDVIVSPASQVVVAGIGTRSAASTNRALWRSTDRGLTWAMVPSVPPNGNNRRMALAQSRSNPSRMYLSIDNRQNSRVLAMYRSDDEGATWTTIPTAGGTNGFCSQQCWYDMVLEVDAGNPDLVYAAGLDLWRSTDGGQTWSRRTSWTADPQAANYAHADHHWLLSPAPGVIWTANDGGVSVSDDGGDTWQFAGETLETAQYYHITTDPVDENYVLGGTQDNGTHLFAGSVTWSEVIGGDGFWTAIDWNDPDYQYGSLYYLNLARSPNRGRTFFGIGAGIDPNDIHPFISRFALDRSNPRNMFVMTQRLWKSTDRGDNFADISSGTVFTTQTGGYLTAVDNCRDRGDAIWVGTRDGRVWNTMDGGATWVDRSAGLPNRFVNAISVHPGDPLEAFVAFAGAQAGQHIYRTRDGGATWTDVSAALPDITFNVVLVLEDQPNVIVAGADVGIYRSDDSGATWQVYGTGLPNVAVEWLSYAPIPGTLRAGTHGRGAWQLLLERQCALAPGFAGLESIALDGLEPCRPELRWSPATSTCPFNSRVRYNIYRSTDPSFRPGPQNLLVAGYPEVLTSYVDATAQPGVTYSYIVRAEDGQQGFGGPANGGKEDPNERVLRVTAGDPAAAGTFRDDGGDTVAWLGGAGWGLDDQANATTGGRFCYQPYPRDYLTYLPNTCVGVETPELRLGPGAVLSYQASWNIEESWDGLVVQVSTDRGASWSDLPPDQGYPGNLSQTQDPPINACGLPATTLAFSGPPGNTAPTPFATLTSDLSAYAGQDVRVRWLLTTDPGSELEGFFLDDVAIAPVVSRAAPDMGNVLRASKNPAGPRFWWADAAPGLTYRVYHSEARPFAPRDLVDAAPSGAGLVLDRAARPRVHYYRMHAVADCVNEGP